VLLGLTLGDLLAMLVCRGLGATFRCDLALPTKGIAKDDTVAGVVLETVAFVGVVGVVAVGDGEDGDDNNSKSS
jgi:hypothetical protein